MHRATFVPTLVVMSLLTGFRAYAQSNDLAGESVGLAGQDVKILRSQPSSGFVDVFQDRTEYGEAEGVNRINVEFDRPVRLSVESVEVVTTAGDAPAVQGVYGDDTDWIIVLDRPIPAGETTGLSFWDGREIIVFRSRPADVNLDGVANQLDLTELETAVQTGKNDTTRFDVNRDGHVNEKDVGRLLDLLYGADGGTPWLDNDFPGTERDIQPLCCCGPTGGCYVVMGTGCPADFSQTTCPCNPNPCDEVIGG